MAGNKTLNENKATSQKPLMKRVYRLKLEIDIFAMINEGTERIERGLQISVKDSDIYFDKFDDVGENCHISAIPPRHIICSDIFFTASDSHQVKINFLALLYLSRLVDRDKLVGDG